MLYLRVKEPHTLPIYKLNVLMTLLFYTLHFPEDVNIYICEDIYKVLSHISFPQDFKSSQSRQYI